MFDPTAPPAAGSPGTLQMQTRLPSLGALEQARPRGTILLRRYGPWPAPHQQPRSAFTEDGTLLVGDGESHGSVLLRDPDGATGQFVGICPPLLRRGDLLAGLHPSTLTAIVFRLGETAEFVTALPLTAPLCWLPDGRLAGASPEGPLDPLVEAQTKPAIVARVGELHGAVLDVAGRELTPLALSERPRRLLSTPMGLVAECGLRTRRRSRATPTRLCALEPDGALRWEAELPPPRHWPGALALHDGLLFRAHAWSRRRFEQAPITLTAHDLASGACTLERELPIEAGVVLTAVPHPAGWLALGVVRDQRKGALLLVTPSGQVRRCFSGKPGWIDTIAVRETSLLLAGDGQLRELPLLPDELEPSALGEHLDALLTSEQDGSGAVLADLLREHGIAPKPFSSD